MTDNASPVIADPLRTARTRRWATCLLFLVAICEGYDLQAAGVAAPQMAPHFAMGPNALGWFFGVGTFGLMIGAALGGRLSDRFGRKPVLIGSVGCFGLFSLVTALAATTEQLLVIRFLTGLGMGGTLPNIIALASEYAAPDKRARAVGIVYAGMPVGAALTSIVGMVGTGEADWRWIFIIGGMVPLALIIVLALALPAVATPGPAGAPAGGTRATGWTDALFAHGRAVNTALLWTASVLTLLSTYILINWLPSLLVARGLGRETALGVQFAFNLAGIAGSLLGGWVLDRKALRTRGVVGLFAAYMACVLLLAAAPPDAVLFIALGGLIGTSATAAAAMLYALAPAAYPAAVRGTGVGTGVAVGRLGSTIGPLLAGFLLGAGQSPAGVIMTMVPIIALGAAAAAALSARTRNAA